MQYLKEVMEKKRYIGLIVLFLLLAAFFYVRSKSEPIETESVLESNTTLNSHEKEVEIAETVMYVDVKGAVKMPGMYEVSSDMRFLNVIDLAGGLLEEADSQRVNFAQKIEDQMVIYIPKVGEELEEVAVVQSSSKSAEDSEGKININQASKEELMMLNGVGEKKAEKIIDYREENGSFQKIEDLKNVNGFGEKSFDSLAKYITI